MTSSRRGGGEAAAVTSSVTSLAATGSEAASHRPRYTAAIHPPQAASVLLATARIAPDP